MDITFSDFLGIISIVATILIGIAGIYYAFRLKNQPRLTFIRQEILPLFKSIVKNLDEIEIKFKNSPISPSLILLKASIVNTGNIDLDKSFIHKPLKISLPKDTKIIQVKISDFSEGVNPTVVNTSNNETEFIWELLKKNEFFTFDILFEKNDSTENNKIDDYESIRKIEKEISFNHRITNLSSVSKETLFSVQKSKQTKRFIPILTVYIVLSAILLFISAFFDKKECHYLIKSGENIIELTATPTFGNNLNIKSIDKTIDTTMTYGQFINEYNLPIKFVTNRFSFYFPVTMSLSLLIVSIAGVLFFFYLQKRDKKIRKLLKVDDL